MWINKDEFWLGTLMDALEHVLLAALIPLAHQEQLRGGGREGLVHSF
jgi:hypothetical protein